MKNTSNGYENYLSDDHKTITEFSKKQWTLEEKEKEKTFDRVVFMQMRDRFGRRCVRFLGVYRQKEVTCDYAIYERVKTKVYINDLWPKVS